MMVISGVIQIITAQTNIIYSSCLSPLPVGPIIKTKQTTGPRGSAENHSIPFDKSSTATFSKHRAYNGPSTRPLEPRTAKIYEKYVKNILYL